MKKQILSLFLAIFLVIPPFSQALEPNSSVFLIEDGVLLRYLGSGKQVIVPSVIQGQTVSSIGIGAFQKFDEIQSISLPDTVISIDEQAFSGCISLETINIPQNLETIGLGAFYDCRSLEEVILPETLHQVGAMAFQGCSSLTKVYLPSSLEEVAKQMFMDCGALTEITLSQGIKYISPYAFRGCASLETIIFPISLVSVEQSAFQYCTRLSEIHFAGSQDQANELYLYPVENQKLFDALWVYFDETPVSTEAKYSEADYDSLVRADDLELKQTTARVGEILDLESEISPSNASIEEIKWTLLGESNGAQVKQDQFLAREIGTYEVEAEVVNFWTGQLFFRKTFLISVKEAQDEVIPPSKEIISSNQGKFLPYFTLETPLTQSPISSSNKHSQNYTTFALGQKSVLLETQVGYSRLEWVKDALYLEQYDKNFQLYSQKTIPLELEEYVEFYEGISYYYLLFSAENPEELSSKEVLRVVKYDKNWNRISSTSLSDINTIGDVHTASMVEVGENLLIHSCHTMYGSSGQIHQANLRISIDWPSMTLISTAHSLSNSNTGYVSDSLQQKIAVSQDGFLVTADHGDAYPRSMVIYAWEDNVISDTENDPLSAEVFPLAGSLGNTITGARLADVAVSSSSVLLAGSSTQQSDSGIYSIMHNIFLTITPQEGFSTENTEIKWITNHDTSIYTSSPHLVPLKNEEYLLMWNEFPYGYSEDVALCWMTLDGKGNQTSPLYRSLGLLSDVSPFENLNGEVLWYVTGDSAPVFYVLDYKKPEITEYYSDSGSSKALSITKISDAPLNPDSSENQTASTWAVEIIDEAQELGLLQGMTDLKVNYQGYITREQFCRLMMNCYRHLGGSIPSTLENPFTDTDNADVSAAFLLGMVTGTSPTTFEPDLIIPREEMAVMIMALSNIFSPAEGNYGELDARDSDEVSFWALNSMVYVQYHGFMTGSYGYFYPHAPLSCEGAVAVVLQVTKAFQKGT